MCMFNLKKNKHEDKIQTIFEIESQAPCLSNPGLRVSHYVSWKKNPHKFHLNPSRIKKKISKGLGLLSKSRLRDFFYFTAGTLDRGVV